MTHARLGTIIKCQVSAQGLVRDKRYVASDIIDAEELHLSSDGIVGWCDGHAVLNHHHRLHPRLGTWKPHRLLSVGFLGHYSAMAGRFGEATVGCSAENVIVDLDRVVPLEELAAGLQVRTADGDTIDLEGPTVAKPCVPFTKYMLRDPSADDETVAPNRAFLDGGMRGFVLGLGDLAEVSVVRPGDELWAVAA